MITSFAIQALEKVYTNAQLESKEQIQKGGMGDNCSLKR